VGVPAPTQSPVRDVLAIPSPSLLDEYRPFVEEVASLADELGIELGWHYLVDLAWVVQAIGPVAGRTILDAGAGLGVLQWYLAAHGARVISVDRMARNRLPRTFRDQFVVRGLREGDLDAAPPPPPAMWRRLASRLKRLVLDTNALRHGYRGRWRDRSPSTGGVKSAGEVVLYNQDLRFLSDVADESIDEVVSISSLEHNDPADLPIVVRELMRVLVPGGRIVATLGASPSDDWFHEPSRGWCYSEATLRRAFGIDPTVSTNFADYASLLYQYQANEELRARLPALYFRSGSNGMPWGHWDPKYLPVAVAKVKLGETA
jgi:SAM-dependent methyltransferase